MFKIELIGNLGADVEVKNDNGRQYAQFSVADTRRFKKDDGTESEVTNWFSCFYRNVDSDVLKYLKKGTRVFVRGNGELRLFSSAKEHAMKAGASINVMEIELVGGGSTDAIPRQVALSTGAIVGVYKAYYIDANLTDHKECLVYNVRTGESYNCDCHGFVTEGIKVTQNETASNDSSSTGSTQTGEHQPQEQQPAASKEKGRRADT